MGFPGDGFQDKADLHPAEVSDTVVEGGDTEMNETTPSDVPSSGKKHNASAPVPPDALVSRPPKWSWFGVLFTLDPYGMFSDRKEYPTVWVCACTKGCRKVYEKRTHNGSVIMDHLSNVYDIAKDTTHQTVLSTQAKAARQQCKQRAPDAGMSESRFQAICTTRYIIRRFLSFIHVECPEFCATVHPEWKVIKVETQFNLVAEMYVFMFDDIKKTLVAFIVTSLLPPFWINADLWTSKVTKALTQVPMFVTKLLVAVT